MSVDSFFSDLNTKTAITNTFEEDLNKERHDVRFSNHHIEHHLEHRIAPHLMFWIVFVLVQDSQSDSGMILPSEEFLRLKWSTKFKTNNITK